MYLYNKEESYRPTLSLVQCTVNINGRLIRGVFDQLDPSGLRLALFFESHPHLMRKTILLPDGRIVNAYIINPQFE